MIPDMYPYIVRESVVVRTVVRQPPAPSADVLGIIYRSVDPPSGVPILSTLALSTAGMCSIQPRVSPSYEALAIPSPSTPGVIGSVSTSVDTRKTP